MAMAEEEGVRHEFIERVSEMPRAPFPDDDELARAPRAERSIPVRTATAVLLIILGVVGATVASALYDPRAGIIVGSALLLGLGLLLGFA